MDYHLPWHRVEREAATLMELTGKDSVEWWSEQMGVPEILRHTNGEGYRVAVLDTGCDLEHPDLKHVIEDAKDFTGWNNPDDEHGHGTHCSGCIAADGKLKGMAVGAKLIIGKVLDRNGSGSDQGITNGIRYAVSKGVDAISMSLGGPNLSQGNARAIQEAVKAGIVVFCAAGNDGRPQSVNYPAKLVNTIAVSAIDRHGRPTDFSSTGPEVDVAGYGQDIRSTYKDGRYSVMSGTSMACPIICGAGILVMANMKARGETYEPTPANIRKFLRATAKDMGAPGRDWDYGFGIFNPETMIKEPAPVPSPQPPAPTPSDPDTGEGEGPGQVVDLEIRIGGKRYSLVPLE